MKMKSYTKDDVVVLELEGKVEGEGKLYKKLDALLQEGHKKVIIDLGKNPSFSRSRELGLILAFMAKFKGHGGNLRFANLPLDFWGNKPIDSTACSAVSFFQRLGAFDTLDEAIASFTK